MDIMELYAPQDLVERLEVHLIFLLKEMTSFTKFWETIWDIIWFHLQKYRMLPGFTLYLPIPQVKVSIPSVLFGFFKKLNL